MPRAGRRAARAPHHTPGAVYVLSFFCFEPELTVADTEIDWQAYMQQAAQIMDGQRNYTLVAGGTGPLVYPAGHVAIFTALSRATDGGTDLLTAQYIFLGVYIATLVLVLVVYRPTGFARTSYLWFAPLLSLSKRLHSIYLLRLFNDCFATFFGVAAVAALQRRRWTLSAVLLSASVSVKMGSLLYLPGAAVIYLQALGLSGAIVHAAVPFLAVQAIVAAPFLLDLSALSTLVNENASKGFANISLASLRAALASTTVSPFAADYFSRAFEFSRAFLYKWTVNWKCVPESIFQSRVFATILLVAHLVTLLFFCCRRGGWWMSPLQPARALASPFQLGTRALVRALFFEPSAYVRAHRPMSPDYILATLATSNLIGILFARSLHYQFYAWFFWCVPYAAHVFAQQYGVVAALALVAAQEWAWLAYPATPLSSFVVLAVLAAWVWGFWQDGLRRYLVVRARVKAKRI